MNKRLLAILVCVVFAAAALLTSAVMALAGAQKADPVIKIYDDTFKKKKKPAVTFTHEKHAKDYKIKCDQCHHVYKDGKQVWKEGDAVAKCASCHKSPKKNDGKMLSLYNAFHKNCRDCHKEAKKGPTKCAECHPKKK